MRARHAGHGPGRQDMAWWTATRTQPETRRRDRRHERRHHRRWWSKGRSRDNGGEPLGHAPSRCAWQAHAHKQAVSAAAKRFSKKPARMQLRGYEREQRRRWPTGSGRYNGGGGRSGTLPRGVPAKRTHTPQRAQPQRVASSRSRRGCGHVARLRRLVTGSKAALL